MSIISKDFYITKSVLKQIIDDKITYISFGMDSEAGITADQKITISFDAPPKVVDNLTETKFNEIYLDIGKEVSNKDLDVFETTIEALRKALFKDQ